YWGEDHRAFVTPLELRDGDPKTPRPIALVGEPWTLITFHDKDVARTVNVEWLVIVVVLLVAYAGAYVAGALRVLFLPPHDPAPRWPRPSLAALPPLVVLTATFGGAIVALSATEATAAAALLPFLSWIAAYHALSPRALAGKWTWTVTIGAGLAALLVAALAW